MDRHPIARTASLALVAGGSLVTAAALLGPATWRQGEAHGKPSLAVFATVALLGPVLSALCAVTTHRPGRRTAAGPAAPGPGSAASTAGVAGAGALVAGVVAAAASAGEATLDGLAGGGPLAAVGAAMSAVGWLVAALTPAGPESLRPVASATVLVVLLGWLGPAAVHAAARSRVDARPGDRPFAAAAAPAGLDDRWNAPAPGRVVDVVGGLVLIRDRTGVRTLDAATGRPVWRYLRPGTSVAGLGSAAGGRVVVGLWRADGVTRAIGFDTATGERRWDRRVDVSTVDHQVVGSGPLAVLVPRGAADGTGDVVALDSDTGRTRWTWRSSDASCAPTAGATSADPARDDVVAIAFSCPAGRRVAGLSTRDGSTRWTWAPAPGSVDLPPRGTAPGGSVPSGYGPLLVGTAGGVLVNDGATGIVLSMASGRAGGTHPAGGRLAATAGNTALYLGSDASGDVAVGADLAVGRERWRTPLPAATTPVGVAALDGSGFALVVPDRGGPARLLRYDLATGTVTSQRQVDDAAVTLWIGPGVLILATSGGRVSALA